MKAEHPASCGALAAIIAVAENAQYMSDDTLDYALALIAGCQGDGKCRPLETLECDHPPAAERCDPVGDSARDLVMVRGDDRLIPVYVRSDLNPPQGSFSPLGGPGHSSRWMVAVPVGWGLVEVDGTKMVRNRFHARCQPKDAQAFLHDAVAGNYGFKVIDKVDMNREAP